jgi:hypothetical protein
MGAFNVYEFTRKSKNASRVKTIVIFISAKQIIFSSNFYQVAIIGKSFEIVVC